MILQISSGMGPVECSAAVGGIFRALQKEFPDIEMITGVKGEVEGAYSSIIFTSEQDLSALEGTMQWVCKSGYRPGHKRKNWFVDVSIIEEPDEVDEKITEDKITFPNLMGAFDVIKAWGFDYKTVAFVWVKQNKKCDSLFWGMGYWTRSNAEICLLATKGHPKRIGRAVHQVIISHIEQHSKKPAETRDRIVELVGDVPRVELFARQKTPGWDSWGNEVESDLELAA
ncbi:MT-A70 family methyltransferase [Butyrivibrio sp. YAB3001]|uniref:MT-A70 family methyltransferase n=1 Tax=Butyrivibrio sp. YAB3001 TaxID=1520812 RepID=UPI0008F6281D|nr:MT-A70 family methyltransferase [Butyrivibrio sp. YAB3001]SFC54379.1 MT-A70 [Butyrivibrio sp. YAB3001]